MLAEPDGMVFAIVKGCRFAFVVEGHGGGLRPACRGYGDLVKVDLEGVQRDGVGGPSELQVDEFVAFKRVGWEIDGEGERIVVG
jgi:hypothetical protein